MLKKNNIMDFILLKKISLLFLLVSSAFAGRVSKFEVHGDEAVIRHPHGMGQEDGPREVHGRLLRVKTNDYGRYDPSPTFVKPPFKLIPN